MKSRRGRKSLSIPNIAIVYYGDYLQLSTLVAQAFVV